MNKRAVWLLLTLFLLSCSTEQSNGSGYKLQYVQDGDSAVLCCNKGQKFTVRLLDIDAPEKHQPYARQSRQKLQSLLQGESLILHGNKHDKYGRRLVVIEVNGETVNDKMVTSGAAWVWRYSKSQRLKALQQEAKQQKRGLWSLPEAQRQDPWQWRQTH